jgi:predicted NBD/HSP70 family sugar kinase
VSSTADLLALAAQGEPAVVDELRDAGGRIGRVLGVVVNFFNPKEIVLAGSMSAAPPLVSAIRSELYRMCLPLAADALEVRASRAAQDAAIRGASILALDEFLAPARVDELAGRSALRTASAG